MSERKDIKEIEKALDAVNAELEKLHDAFDHADKNDAVGQVRIMSKISQAADRHHSLLNLKKLMLGET